METEPTDDVVEDEDGHHSMGVPKRKRTDHDESVKCDRRGQYYGHGCQVGGEGCAFGRVVRYWKEEEHIPPSSIGGSSHS